MESLLLSDLTSPLKHVVSGYSLFPLIGKVSQVVGNLVETAGPPCSIGDLMKIETQQGQSLPCEVVGFRDGRSLLMPMGSPNGLTLGSKVTRQQSGLQIPFSREMLGRVIDSMGNPIDGGARITAQRWLPLDQDPPSPLLRKPIQEAMVTGVRAVDSLLLTGKGQRIGLFAGSGVGKSTLMGMIARRSSASINVVALIGERGREVQEFVQRVLGQDGMERTIVVAATSDQSPLLRVKAAFTATAIAEALRAEGEDVMLFMDSVTRVAMAQREIGLAAGEPPTTRGYTPSVFSLLPKLLERSGCDQRGSITALYTVLVEGDDMNEPIADAVRGILDGHWVLSRSLAHQNHFPAIDVLASVSRLMNEIATPEHRQNARDVRRLMAAYEENKDLVQLGAYQPGSNPDLDLALECRSQIRQFLEQEYDQYSSFETTMRGLQECQNPSR
jgi:flagellum-specific ATP synthase